MSGDYAALAPYYDLLGLSAFVENMMPRVLAHAQSNDWLGRRILVVGCGTGGGVGWLANRGYNVTGVDNSRQMLDVAQENIDSTGLSLRWREADLRTLERSGSTDLVIGIDVINDLASLRDVEQTFRSIHKLLDDDKMLVFDLHTIEGLAQRAAGGTRVILEDDQQMFFATHQFDYERQTNTCRYILFEKYGDTWKRQEACLTLRGFPVQAIVALLGRCGFSVPALVNLNFEPFDPADSRAPRVLVYAQKRTSGDTA